MSSASFSRRCSIHAHHLQQRQIQENSLFDLPFVAANGVINRGEVKQRWIVNRQGIDPTGSFLFLLVSGLGKDGAVRTRKKDKKPWIHFAAISRGGPYELDPNFIETVILVLEHSDKGGFGVILNRPAERKPSFSWESRNRPLLPGRPELYSGGPVTGPYLAVHTLESYAEREILPGVVLFGQEKNVLAITQREAQPCKIFVGYSGWAAGQLGSD